MGAGVTPSSTLEKVMNFEQAAQLIGLAQDAKTALSFISGQVCVIILIYAFRRSYL